MKMHIKYMLAALMVIISGCSSEDMPAVPSSAVILDSSEEIKAMLHSVSGDVITVGVNKILFGVDGEPIEYPLYFVEIDLKKDFIWGGAQDWNSLASTVGKISKVAFDRNDIGRLRFRAISDGKSDWAYVDFRKHKLPENWKSGSYLERFAAADDVSSPYPQAQDALCKFYSKYTSAKPMVETQCPS